LIGESGVVDIQKYVFGINNLPNVIKIVYQMIFLIWTKQDYLLNIYLKKICIYRPSCSSGKHSKEKVSIFVRSEYVRHRKIKITFDLRVNENNFK